MVTKFLDLNNLSWGRRSFALSNDRGKVLATVLFLNAIMHRKFIHVNFFVLFCYISRAGTVCWDAEMLLPWQRDVTTSPLYWKCFEDILGGGVSSVDCTYGLATKRYRTQRFNGEFLVLIRFPVKQVTYVQVTYKQVTYVGCLHIAISMQAFRVLNVPCFKRNNDTWKVL